MKRLAIIGNSLLFSSIGCIANPEVSIDLDCDGPCEDLRIDVSEENNRADSSPRRDLQLDAQLDLQHKPWQPGECSPSLGEACLLEQGDCCDENLEPIARCASPGDGTGVWIDPSTMSEAWCECHEWEERWEIACAVPGFVGIDRSGQPPRPGIRLACA